MKNLTKQLLKSRRSELKRRDPLSRRNFMIKAPLITAFVLATRNEAFAATPYDPTPPEDVP
jgi:hypothetical protein